MRSGFCKRIAEIRSSPSKFLTSFRSGMDKTNMSGSSGKLIPFQPKKQISFRSDKGRTKEFGSPWKLILLHMKSDIHKPTALYAETSLATSLDRLLGHVRLTPYHDVRSNNCELQTEFFKGQAVLLRLIPFPFKSDTNKLTSPEVQRS